MPRWRAQPRRTQPLTRTQTLEAAGVSQDRIMLLSILASPDGIDRVCDRFPDVKIVTAAVDMGVDEKGRTCGDEGVWSRAGV